MVTVPSRGLVAGEEADSMNQTQRNSAIKQLIKDYTAKNTKTPEAARAALIREGIYTADGKLMPEFGGPRGKKTKPPEPPST